MSPASRAGHSSKSRVGSFPDYSDTEDRLASGIRGYQARQQFQATRQEDPGTVFSAVRRRLAEAQVALLAVRLGRVAENSGHHQLGWLLTGMPNPPFQLVQVLPQRAQEDPEGFLGHPRWVGANPAYFKDVDYLKGRAKLVGRQPPSDRPRGSSPEPKAKPKEAPKAAAKAAAAGSGTQ